VAPTSFDEVSNDRHHSAGCPASPADHSNSRRLITGGCANASILHGQSDFRLADAGRHRVPWTISTLLLPEVDSSFLAEVGTMIMMAEETQ
jgi:hypothetical protein